MTHLEIQFAKEVRDALREGKAKYKFKATRFLQMMNKYGAVGTACKILGTGATTVQRGLTELALRCRLDLSIEAKVINPKYRSLFSDELRDVARRRLESYEFDFEASMSKPGRRKKQKRSIADKPRSGRRKQSSA